MLIVFDNSAGSGSGSSGSTFSFNATIGSIAANGLIVVQAVGVRSSNGQTAQRITGVTFNGVAMTLVASDENLGNRSCSTAFYALRGSSVPAAGTYTVVISYSGTAEARIGGYMSFKIVKNQDAEATATNDKSTTGDLAQSITTLTENAVVVVGYAAAGANFLSWSGGDEITKIDQTTGGGVPGEMVLAYKLTTSPGVKTSTAHAGGIDDVCKVLLLASFQVENTVGAPFFAIT